MRGGEGERSQLGPSFAAKSWGYSAFQYILPCQAPETNRCASRFATTASALRASAAPQPGGRALKLRNFPEKFGRHTGADSALMAVNTLESFITPELRRAKMPF